MISKCPNTHLLVTSLDKNISINFANNIYIENIKTAWHKKLCMKTWCSSKIFMNCNNFSYLIFWFQNVLIPPSPKISQGAKCVNTAKLYTTNLYYHHLCISTINGRTLKPLVYIGGSNNSSLDPMNSSSNIFLKRNISPFSFNVMVPSALWSLFEEQQLHFTQNDLLCLLERKLLKYSNLTFLFNCTTLLHCFGQFFISDWFLDLLACFDVSEFHDLKIYLLGAFGLLKTIFSFWKHH